MDWAFVFGAVNLIAIIAWICLVLLPRWPALLSGILYLGVGLLCFVYAAGLIGLLTGTFGPGGGPGGGGADFTSIEGVRAVFATDAGVTIGWTHYLAFDLFVGLWIVRDGDAKKIPRLVQAPVLIATFLAGPIGLFVWLILREPIARRHGRFR